MCHEDALIKAIKGRETLAHVIEGIAVLEAQAVAEIEKALVAEGVNQPSAEGGVATAK